MNNLARQQLEMAGAIGRSAQAVSNEKDALRLLTMQNRHPYIELGQPNTRFYRWLYWDDDTENYKAGRELPGFKPEEHKFDSFIEALDWILV